MSALLSARAVSNQRVADVVHAVIQDVRKNGDKARIGTNHVLPTRKAGNYTGGLWVGKFLKTQTYQEILDEKASGEMGRLCARCSRAENFEGHARSGDLRAHKYLGDDHDWVKKANIWIAKS
ncbi:hypothetical protein D7B24_006671 [Verticillium nonalfalfae]|uniref:Uncharacterized protein n=1 Tax=Verticillium nonalfalfae TaxID=1051616 RepID=A0A3M9YJ63_9PEZI|nr:uncharacterized protein D7B24_006671 [Verticillium nonalfalfae]RNJ60603.1 hypothetical protein D7B24_006671 [Verticillium nonalfalfae]